MTPIASQSVQHLQEEEYAFPYHHVVTFRDRFSQAFYHSWGINYAATIELLVELLKRRSFASVVDVGCGDGRLVGELMREFPTKKIVGLDYSARAINLAKAMVPDGEFLQTDITKQTVGDKYDVAMLIEVIEHIPPEATVAFLSSVRGVLAAGGELVVTVPHANQPVEPKHYRHFTEATLVEVLTESGFKVTSVQPFEKLSPAKRIVDTILGNRFFLLNSRRVQGWLYEFYKRRLLRVSHERDCARLLVTAVAREG